MARFFVVTVAALATAVVVASGAGAGGTAGSGCIAHRPVYIEDVFESSYTAGCSGHDEPELDPISSLPGSAQNLTWRFILPRDGTSLVSDVGPTFWFGGTVTDPNPKDVFGQGFLEVQFYPDGVVTNCTPNGGFVLHFQPNTYTVCSPVWSIRTTGQKPNYHEPAAFNAMLTTGAKHAPLVMHAGDTIRLHFHVVSQAEGWHIDVLDETTGGSGTIVLNGAQGPISACVLDADTRQLAQLGQRLRHPELVRLGNRPHLAVFEPRIKVLPSGCDELRLLQRVVLARLLAAPHPVGQLRHRQHSAGRLGGRQRLRRQRRDQPVLRSSRRALLRLSVVHARKRRNLPLRRRLPRDRERLRQGHAVRYHNELRQPYLRSGHALLRQPDRALASHSCCGPGASSAPGPQRFTAGAETHRPEA